MKIDGVRQVLDVGFSGSESIEVITNFNNEIIVIENSKPLSNAVDELPLVLFRYDTLLDQQICITEIIDIITEENQKIVKTNNLPQCSNVTFQNNPINDVNVQIYPNPSSAIIFFSAYKPLEKIEIYDSKGSHVMDFSSSEMRGLQYDVKYLDSGIYFLKIFIEEQIKIIKFLTQ
ncbi:MAG: T9SS type A sorting domain-containing protein [Saprospiraceae bacterium]|nr:T9SS type A sorting domain-containing protein [Saprospiraceae bacterium]